MKKLLVLSLGLMLTHTGFALNNAAVVSISAPASVAPGASFTATITMQNTGDQAWTPTEPNVYSLGSESPRNNLTFLDNGRVPLPTNSVNPGDTAAFTTTFTAPTTPGIYNFSWVMVQELVEFFGEIATTQITVGNGQFNPGDLVLMQAVATAANDINNRGSALVLKSFSPSSLTTTFHAALPFKGTNVFIGGLSQFTGMIDLTTDKNSIVVAGYLSDIGVSSVEVAGSLRGVGTVSSTGVLTRGAETTTGGSTFRGTVADGSGNFWSGGQADGIQYLGTNSAAIQISLAGSGAIRDMIMVNGKPHFSTSQFPISGSHGIAAFTNVSPTTAQDPVIVIDTGNTVTLLTGTPSAKGFYFNTNLTIAYVVDQRASPNGGIFRYNGTGTGQPGSWTYQYNITNSSSATGGSFHEILVDFSGANPKVYATSGDRTGNSQVGFGGTNLVSFIDTGILNPTFTLLATASLDLAGGAPPGVTTFRGLTFAPNAALTPTQPVLSIAKSGSDIVVSWTGGGTLRSSATVDGTYAPVAGSPTSPYTTAPSGSSLFYRVSIP